MTIYLKNRWILIGKYRLMLELSNLNMFDNDRLMPLMRIEMDLPLTTQNFRKFAGQFPTGIAIVTLRDQQGRLYGATLNSVASLSLNPLLYLVCLANDSNTLSVMSRGTHFCIHYLAKDQRNLSELFSSKISDKFALIPHEISEFGCPVILGATARSECKVVDMHLGGDHTIVVGEVKALFVEERQPLMFFRGKYTDLESLKTDRELRAVSSC